MLGRVTVTHSFVFGFVLTNADDQRYRHDELELLVDELADEMVSRETDLVFDSSITASLTSGEVDLEVSVEADSDYEAGTLARDFVIEAIRATGGTPIGLFVFPPATRRRPTGTAWNERRSEVATA
jgi:hypothetical protein